MQRTICLFLALFLTVVGAGAFVFLVFFAAGWEGWMLMAAGGVFVTGVMWLYSDFTDNAAPSPESTDEDA